MLHRGKFIVLVECIKNEEALKVWDLGLKLDKSCVLNLHKVEIEKNTYKTVSL